VSGAVSFALWIVNRESGLLEAVRCLHAEKPVPRASTYGLIGKCYTEERSQLVNFSTAPLKVLEAEFNGAKHIAVTPVKGPNGMLGAIAVWHAGEWDL